MRGLTLHQPWATLIADGRKRYETRGWKPPADVMGERIAIHAGASKEGREAAEDFGLEWDRLPLGAIVCTAQVVAAHHVVREHRVGPGAMFATSAADSLDREADPDFDVSQRMFPTDDFGDYAPGRWAFRLVDVERVEPPAPCRGFLYLWVVPAGVL